MLIRLTPMLTALTLVFSLSCGQLPPESSQVTATVDTAMLKKMQASQVKIDEQEQIQTDLWQVRVPQRSLEQIADIAHTELNRCGGFVYEGDSNSLGQETTTPEFGFDSSRSTNLGSLLSIKQQPTVTQLLAQIQEMQIRQTIMDLAAFPTRHSQTQQGVNSQQFVYDLWQSLTQSRSDVKLEKVIHKGWPQPSIILTMTGQTLPDEIVVLGGHGDSIAPSFLGVGGKNNRAPGADDNASGIAVLSEVIRVLSDGNYKPARTLMFMSYAAEEVGLRGSNEIAKSFKASNKDVLAVMQLDMVNFNSNTQDPTIAMITDYTDNALTSYVETLIDAYTPIKHEQDKCGYACSDHASWYKLGFATVLPHEAISKERNNKIHTKYDTLDLSHNQANLAEKFAKIALAFAVEMGN